MGHSRRFAPLSDEQLSEIAYHATEARRNWYDTPDKDATDDQIFAQAGRDYGDAMTALERRGKS